MATIEKATRNFIKTYGKVQFKWLLNALANGENGQKIADEMGVSRERVRQWKNLFGSMVTMYRIHPDVLKVIKVDESNTLSDNFGRK